MKHRIVLVFITIFLCFIFRSTGLLDTYWALSFPYLIGSVFLMALLPFNFLKIWLMIMIPVLLIGLVIISNISLTCAGWIVCFNKITVVNGFAKLFLIFTILIILSKSLYLWFIFRRNKRNI